MHDGDVNGDLDLVGLRVTRAVSPIRDALRRYKILVDGETVGTLRRDETLDLRLTRAVHRVEARLDWTGSGPLLLDLFDGEPRRLEVAPNGSGATAFGQVFSRDRYLILHEVDR